MAKNILNIFIPYTIKRWMQTLYPKFKYKVKIGKGAHIHKTVFGKYCLIGESSNVFGSRIGRSTYIANNGNITFAKIGKFCAIGNNLNICLGNHPTEKIVSIHPCFYSLYGQATPPYINKQIFEEHKFISPKGKYVVEIGNDVWIGNDVSILDGIKIGDGAVIGIGSIVTHDVEPYSIVVGSPARHVRYRFSDEEREFLLKFRWWDKSDEWFYNNAKYFSEIKMFTKHFMDKY